MTNLQQITKFVFTAALLVLLFVATGFCDEGKKPTEKTKDAPAEYSRSQLLEKLDLAIAKADDLGRKIVLQKMHESAKRDDTTLSLSYNRLTQVPPEIGLFTNLTELFLGQNDLTTLPPEILKLTKLTHLAIDHNKFSKLPPEVTNLTQLTKLHLHNNQITTLSPEIGKLTKLTQLQLSYNLLTELPPDGMCQ